MVDLIDIAASSAIAIFLIGAIAIYLETARSTRLLAIAIAGLWVGFASAAAAAGWLAISDPLPIIGVFVATPLVTIAGLALLSHSARQAMLGLPMRLLVGLNAGRLVAVLFFVLVAEHRLAGPFPFFAGAGDIITGAFALLIAGSLSAGWNDDQGVRTRLLIWNLFGIGDLVLAVFLGVTSSEGSRLQLFHFPPGSEAMQHAPFAMVPTVLVPFYLAMHAIVLAKLLTRERAASEVRTLAQA